MQRQCPANTQSQPGATSQLGCRCITGYACSYTKRISATVRLNASAADFNDDVGGIRTAFINAVAAAAGVPASQVTIGSVTQRGSRRLLSSDEEDLIVDYSATPPPDAAGDATTEVHILVEGSQDLRSIHHSLALSTAWQPFHAVRARRVMTA
jgi:hypothetical protein